MVFSFSTGDCDSSNIFKLTVMSAFFALVLGCLLVFSVAFATTLPSFEPQISAEPTAQDPEFDFAPCTAEQLRQIAKRSDYIQYFCSQNTEQSGKPPAALESRSSPSTAGCRKERNPLSRSERKKMVLLGYTFICLVGRINSATLLENRRSSCAVIICAPPRGNRGGDPMKQNLDCCRCRRVCCNRRFETCFCKLICRGCGRRRNGAIM